MKLKHILGLAVSAVLCLSMPPMSQPAAADTASATDKVIALTFDDGPNTTTTNEILDLLEEYDATATFFLIGNNINEESAVTVKRAYDMGCEIGNHSQTHSNMPNMTEEEMLAEIQYVDDYVTEITGESTRYFRPPFIDVNQTMYDTIDKTFICGVGCNDFMADVTTEERIDAILSSAKDGQIYLLHDAAGNDQTVEALKTVIPTLQAEGYELVTLTELFERQGETPKRNILYSQVAKYPCSGYTLHSNAFSGEATGDSSWSGWSQNTTLDGDVLASLGNTYAVEVAYEGSYQPVIVLQRWTGEAIWQTVQPTYYNGERACFLNADIQAALDQNGVTYTDLDRIGIIPYSGTMTVTSVDILVKNSTEAPLRGDVNQDGSTSMADIILLQKYLLGLEPLTESQFSQADLNENGTVDAFDLALLKRDVM